MMLGQTMKPEDEVYCERCDQWVEEICEDTEDCEVYQDVMEDR